MVTTMHGPAKTQAIVGSDYTFTKPCSSWGNAVCIMTWTLSFSSFVLVKPTHPSAIFSANSPVSNSLQPLTRSTEDSFIQG